jgi:predicted RNase H-like HicB family nuclease
MTGTAKNWPYGATDPAPESTVCHACDLTLYRRIVHGGYEWVDGLGARECPDNPAGPHAPAPELRLQKTSQVLQGSGNPAPESAPCGHDRESNWFDRTLCAEPCGKMHTCCLECGAPLDGCAHEPTVRYVAEDSLWVAEDATRQGCWHVGPTREAALAGLADAREHYDDVSRPAPESGRTWDRHMLSAAALSACWMGTATMMNAAGHTAASVAAAVAAVLWAAEATGRNLTRQSADQEVKP